MRIVLAFIAIILVSHTVCNFVFLEDNLTQTAKCPAFTCNSSNNADGKCIVVKDVQADRKVSLFTCPEKKHCLNSDYFDSLLDVSCVDDVPGPDTMKNRLPGEECAEDKDCKLVSLVKGDSDTDTEPVAKCVEKKCQGNEPNKKCVNQESCTVGHYCSGFNETDKKRGTCKPLAKDGEDCTDLYGCSFNSLCSKGKCAAMKSLALGTEVDPLDAALCSTGLAAKDTENKIRCAQRVYDSAKHTTLVNNEVVECDVGSDCYYKNRFSEDTTKDVAITATSKCVCSFSGKGYCPFAGKGMDARTQKIASAAERVSTKQTTHHTNNRLKDNIKDVADVQYSLACRAYYGSPKSYGSSTTCPAATYDLKYCTYMNSSFVKFSLLFLGLILALL